MRRTARRAPLPPWYKDALCHDPCEPPPRPGDTSPRRTALFSRALNPAQRDAVSTTEGPLLVLAGAGTGKTRVITTRIAYLLSLGVDPSSILAVTFTNKAAGEMRERVAAPRGREGARDHGGHVPRVLRAGPARARPRPRASRKFTICDASDQLSAVKSAMRELRVHETTMHPSAVLARISLAKNRMETPESFLAERQRRARPAGGVGLAALPGVPRAARAPSTSTTSCSRRCACCASTRTVREHYREALPPRPRGRVPGHEPPAVRDRPRDRRRAPQRVRGGRRRPVDLRLARGRHPQDPRLPPRLRGRQGRPPADQLPLDPADPRRGQRRHPPQRLAPRQGPRVGAGRRRGRALRAAEGRDVGGAVRGRGDAQGR